MKIYSILPLILFLGCDDGHTVRVVESVEYMQLDDRYTIPAWRKPQSGDPLAGVPVFYGPWHPPEVVHYEKWTITAKDGFVIELERVDPKSQPQIREGERYSGPWK